MKCRAMQFLFVFGLLLTVAAGFLLVRSFSIFDSCWIARAWIDGGNRVHNSISVRTDGGRFHLGFERMQESIEVASRVSRPPLGLRASYGASPSSLPSWPKGDSLWNWIGFDYEATSKSTRDRGYLHRRVSMPIWLIVFVCATMAAAPYGYLRRDKLRQRRRAHGLCVSCGYDLRGAAHEHCPECGHLVPAEFKGGEFKGRG